MNQLCQCIDCFVTAKYSSHIYRDKNILSNQKINYFGMEEAYSIPKHVSFNKVCSPYWKYIKKCIYDIHYQLIMMPISVNIILAKTTDYLNCMVETKN